MPRIKPPRPENEEPEIVEKAVIPDGPIEVEIDAQDDGHREVELAPAVKPAVKPNLVPDDDALKVQVDNAKRAEDLQRQLAEEQRQRAEAQRQLEQAQREREQERGDREEAQYNSVLTAIAAEQSSVAKAKADFAAALMAQDYAAAAEAQEVLSGSKARLDRLEDGKRAFETRKEDKRPELQQPPAPQSFEERIRSLPGPAQSWLRDHPEYINDATKNRQIGTAHNYIVNNRGIQAFSTAYFEALDEEFGFKKKIETQSEPDPAPRSIRRSIPVTAPVSREVPSVTGTRSRGTVTLTPEEVDIAHKSFGPINGRDLTPAEKERLYANNKAKLAREKANGTYTEQTR